MNCLKNTLLIIEAQVTCKKKLRKTKGKEIDDQVYLIKEVLNRMKASIKNVSEYKKFKIEKNEKVINSAERILYFNQFEQKGGLKIITPNEMFSRLPTTLAQLKQKIILTNLKMKLGKFCILCTDQKNLQNNSIKV